MKLKYYILWFEDDPDVIEYTHAPAIEDFLRELGFEPIITHETNASKLIQLMSSNAINDYDLIISDNNLNATDGKVFNGNDIIKKLREGHILTEVLLYSSKPFFYRDVVEKHGWVERASYCVGRDNLAQRIQDIILLTVRKQQDVNNTRGLVIAETILLENKISNILEKYFETAEGTELDGEKSAILDSIRQSRLEQTQAHVSFLGSISSINLQELIDKGILTASNTLDVLNSILNQQNAKIGNALNTPDLVKDERAILMKKQGSIKTLKTEIASFRSEIIEVRNTLAHVEAQVGEDGILFLESRKKGGKTIRFDEDRYTQIRKDLHKHNRNLEDIIKHLSEQ